ncbi:BnaC05g50640D [Brassica napus]|uniref:16S rRNA (uracil(1498)-N(3))-methyltransferase n=1 Tax=Brassica napus TaxID=3708 RepID=A0A078I5Y3_BRANA|nr:BnaC05g50640D [Brassica napus]
MTHQSRAVLSLFPCFRSSFVVRTLLLSKLFDCMWIVNQGGNHFVKEMSLVTWQVFAAFGTFKGGRACERCATEYQVSATPLLTERSSIICGRPAIYGILGMRMNLYTSYLLSQAKGYIKWYWLTIRSNLIPSWVKFNTGNGADFRRKEVELMLQAGYITVGLGPHRLQAETEIIALLATLVMWSDSQETTA